jgi:hypothetical protein
MIAASLDGVAAIPVHAAQHQNGLPALTFHDSFVWPGSQLRGMVPPLSRFARRGIRTGFLP